MNIALIVALSALAGAVIPSVTSIITILIVKRSEDRRHYRELVISTAVEYWKQFIALTPPGETIEPLDDFILHMMKFYDEILTKTLDSKRLEAKLEELRSQSLRLYALRTRQSLGVKPNEGR
jgi:hypothetical protein